jgi:3-deoxy-D-manno-octulosonate 8-phosphate phosphatase (KDO 8-P phosphatase)
MKSSTKAGSKRKIFGSRILEKAKKIKFLLLDVDGVMTDGKIYYDSEGREVKAFNIYDGHGIYLAQKAGIKVGIITGRESKIVEVRAKELKIDEVHQKVIEKDKVYDDIRKRYRLKEEEVAYIGDDLIDLSVLERVGLSAAPANSVDDVKDIVDLVTEKEGGSGAVRELIDLLLFAKK